MAGGKHTNKQTPLNTHAMKTLTWTDFKQHKPCYDPQEKYGDWSGTIIDILNHPQIPDHDKIWAFTRKKIVSDKTLRLFAVACAREAQHLMKDQRSLKALDVAEAFAHGKATEEELEAAAARAAYEAARAAARAAERAAARAAARAAYEAAIAAARAAERAAARAAYEAAIAAARAAERQKQVQIAIGLIQQYEP